MKLPLVCLIALISLEVAAEPVRSLTVKGEGESEVAPDFVRITAKLAAETRETQSAKADVDDRMKKVVSALSSFDIDSRDITFGGASVSETYKYDRNENETPTGYRVERTLEIKLRDLASYEQVIHALVGAGADEIDDPQSDVDDKNKLKLAALKQAASNARINASAIAETLGVSLGSPLEVGEDRLLPSIRFEQGYAEDSRVVQEIVVTAQKRGISNPLLFIPKSIRTKATVWVRFEINAIAPQ